MSSGDVAGNINEFPDSVMRVSGNFKIFLIQTVPDDRNLGDYSDDSGGLQGISITFFASLYGLHEFPIIFGVIPRSFNWYLRIFRKEDFGKDPGWF